MPFSSSKSDRSAISQTFWLAASSMITRTS
jgi:hypothetical protein